MDLRDTKEYYDRFKWDSRLYRCAREASLVDKVKYEYRIQDGSIDYGELTLECRDMYLLEAYEFTARVIKISYEVFGANACNMLIERYVQDRTRKDVADSRSISMRQQAYYEMRVLDTVFRRMMKEDKDKEKLEKRPEEDHGVPGISE